MLWYPTVIVELYQVRNHAEHWKALHLTFRIRCCGPKVIHLPQSYPLFSCSEPGIYGSPRPFFSSLRILLCYLQTSQRATPRHSIQFFEKTYHHNDSHKANQCASPHPPICSFLLQPGLRLLPSQQQQRSRNRTPRLQLLAIFPPTTILRNSRSPLPEPPLRKARPQCLRLTRCHRRRTSCCCSNSTTSRS